MLRFAGLWLIATVAGFLLAVVFNLAIVDPALRSIGPQLVASQAELSVMRDIQFAVLLVTIMLGAALRSGVQATLLEVRLRLGIVWIAASVAAALVAFLLTAAIVQVLRSKGVFVLPNFEGLSILSPIPGLFAGAVGWLILRRLPRGPLLLLAIPVAAIAAQLVQAEIARFFGVNNLVENFAAQALASGVVFGAIEGIALAWILNGRPKIPAEGLAQVVPA
jgi:hypothetical protein